MEVFDIIIEKVRFVDLMRCKLVCLTWWKGINWMRPSAKTIRRKAEALREMTSRSLKQLRTRSSTA